MSLKFIRPHVVFNLIDQAEDCFNEMRLIVPNRHTYTGSPTLLEKALIYALMKYANPKRIFEFGTYVGATTRLFHDNSPAQIYTIDIGNLTQETLGKAVSHADIELIKKTQATGSNHIKGLDRITRIICDSTHYDYSQLPTFDFIWIDGGHDLFVAKPDTEHAYQILDKTNPNACVAWHDYNSDLYPELTQYINEIANDRDIFYIEGTMVCFALPNQSVDLPATLY